MSVPSISQATARNNDMVPSNAVTKGAGHVFDSGGDSARKQLERPCARERAHFACVAFPGVQLGLACEGHPQSLGKGSRVATACNASALRSLRKNVTVVRRKRKP